MKSGIENRGRNLEDDYFRRKEAELIEKMKARMSEEEPAAAALKCPKCPGKLVEVDFEQIKIDICDACGGAWLDAGELEDVTKSESGGWLARLFK